VVGPSDSDHARTFIAHKALLEEIEKQALKSSEKNMAFRWQADLDEMQKGVSLQSSRGMRVPLWSWRHVSFARYGLSCAYVRVEDGGRCRCRTCSW
jgi:hypothetical protein